MPKDFKKVEMQALRKVIGGDGTWVALSFFLLAVFLFNTVRIGRVTGEQVGIMLNKMSGKMEVVNQSGVRIYNGLIEEFYILDKTLQTLDMTKDESRGDRKNRDDLKIKTIDGSDVYVDIKVQYKINPLAANNVVTFSGTKDLYKIKWARDYARTLCRNYLGELTTEEFYDSSKRDVKILLAKNDANKRLNGFGITIDSIVIPTKPHFYKEYEEMIKKKKLADQAVLEEQSKALAAKQRQETLRVEETNRMNVAVEEFEGEMSQKIIEAKANGEKLTKEADAYYDRVTIGAEANLYKLQKNAEGILLKKQADAKGIKALKDALEGKGGRNIVKMEYARKLRGVTITGKPYSISGSVERFHHSKGAASVGDKQ